MAYFPAAPKKKNSGGTTPNAPKKAPLIVPTSAGKRNAAVLSQNKKYSTGAGGYGTVTAGGKQFRVGPNTFVNPKPKPKLTLGEQLRLLLQGGGLDNESPSGVTSVRG